MKVALIAAIYQEPFAPDHRGLVQGLESLKIKYKIVDPQFNNPSSEQLVQQIIEYQLDVVLHGMTDSLKDEIPRRIKDKIKTKQLFCMWDYRPKELKYDNLWDYWKTQASFLDHIFISNKEQIDWWQKDFQTSVSYLPHGCYVFNKLIYDKEFRYPLVFIGQMMDQVPYNKRTELIEQISQKVPLTIID